jgi:hypothetical protein
MSHTEAARTESLGEQEPRGDVESDKKPKNRRPASMDLNSPASITTLIDRYLYQF